MKKQLIYHVDAFSTKLFDGNSAAVCPLENWLSDAQMQSIAMENNLSETAFILREKENEHYQIRWFTPNTEVALCGHATLASAFIIFNYLGHLKEQIIFNSKSGELRVTKNASFLTMDFPALPYTPIILSPLVLKALNIQAVETYESTFDLLMILENEDVVKDAKPNLYEISKLKYRGIILSAPANQNNVDVYSRCFYPGCDVPEDPVTGSAHCVIAPYWSNRLAKHEIYARQGLKRKGELRCEIVNDRVLLSGSCQLYLQGHIFLP